MLCDASPLVTWQSGSHKSPHLLVPSHIHWLVGMHASLLFFTGSTASLATVTVVQHACMLALLFAFL
jgi:hypothetical protein